MNAPHLYYPLSGFFNALTSIVLGIFVFSRGRKNIRNITYGLFCLSVVVWSIFYFIWLMTDNNEVALLCLRGLMAGAIFIPVFYLHHILVLLDLNRIKS